MSSQGRNVFGAGNNFTARPRGDDVLCIPGLLGTLESSFHWMTNSHTPLFERCVAEMLMLAKRISAVEREEKKRQANGANGNVFFKEPPMIERVFKSL